MNILIISATKLEINNFLTKINCNTLKDLSFANHQIDILVGGIGLVFTTYNICKTLESKEYDLVINIGIAGSFNRSLNIGDIVNVKQEEFSGLGAERAEGFQTIFDLGFANQNDFPFKHGKLVNDSFYHKYLDNLANVSAISANTAHASEESINSISEKFNADIETMEGAAVFYVCLMENVSFLQIRSISNYVEANNRDEWDIPLAISNLSEFTYKLLQII